MREVGTVPDPAERTEKPRTVDFEYIKSGDYRVIYADGVHGGPTPRGMVQLSFYAERTPIPRKIVHQILDNQLGPELRDRRESRSGIIRQVAATVVMSLDTARSLREWLDEKIEILESVHSPESEPGEQP